MKKLFLVLACLCFCASIAQAAMVETKAGTKALVFGFGGLSNLGLSGYRHDVGIGGRYYLQDGLAIRPGVEFGIASEKDKSEEDFEPKETTTAFGANVTLEKRMSGGGSISPYAGAGAGFSLWKDKDEASENASTTMKKTSFGVAGVLGFEWGFAEGLTLGGEYTLGLRVASEKTEVDSGTQTTTTRDVSGTGISVGTASIFLSVTI